MSGAPTTGLVGRFAGGIPVGAPVARLSGPAARGGAAVGGPPVGGVAVRGGADVRGGGAEVRGGAATGGVTAAAAPAAGGAVGLNLPGSDLIFASGAGGRWPPASASVLGGFLPSPRRSRSDTLGGRGGGGSHTGTPSSGWGRERSYGAEPAGAVLAGAPADCIGYCTPGRPLAGGAVGVGRRPAARRAPVAGLSRWSTTLGRPAGHRRRPLAAGLLGPRIGGGQPGGH